jgi:deoxycytidine triphosphate deaminase
LELINASQFSVLELAAGMKIGQVVFWRGEPVPAERSYHARGQYNNDRVATPSKGVR